MEKKQIVIRKMRAAYKVTVEREALLVEPFHPLNYMEVSQTVAHSLQLTAKLELTSNKPPDSYTYLISYYQGKGWSVEEL